MSPHHPAATSAVRGLLTAHRACLTTAVSGPRTEVCPVDGTPVQANLRYPRRLCPDCASRVVDADGRALSLGNVSLSGGFVAHHVDDGSLCEQVSSDGRVFVDGAACQAGEAKFGGVVVQLAEEPAADSLWDALLVRIARCPVVEQVRLAGVTDHPCSGVVNYQSHVPLSRHQGPEPWTGHIRTARVLFVSSNPSYGEDDLYPRWSDPDASLVPYFEDRFRGGPGQIQDGVRTPTHDGSKGKWIAFWGGVLGVVREVIPDATPGADYALTEVVRCKTTKEVGVAAARLHCADRYLDATLTQAVRAQLIIIYGKHALAEMNERYELPLTSDNRSCDADVAGRHRRIVWLDHPSHARKVRLHHVLDPAALAELQNRFAEDDSSAAAT